VVIVTGHSAKKSPTKELKRLCTQLRIDLG
jgi:hypothetical protein